MRTFDEHSGRARLIMDWFEMAVVKGSLWHDFELKEPLRDVSRRFLNEIEEFKPSEEVN